MTEDEAAFQQLKWAIQALAASADDQVDLFPSFVCPACELLSDFDDWHGATVWRESIAITIEQRKALEALQAQIGTMKETPCFSTDAIRNRQDWQRLRASAVRCIASFDWECELSPKGRSTYVPGG